MSIISLILFPLVFALLIYVMDKKWSAYLAIIGSGLSLFYFLYLLTGFKASMKVENEFQISWIPGINSELHFGLDSLGIIMILLSVIVVPVGILSSFKYKNNRSKSYYMLMLMGLSALIGFFSAQNDVTFYVFFELALVPFYFIFFCMVDLIEKKRYSNFLFTRSLEVF